MPDPLAIPVSQMSQATLPPFGSVTGKFTETVLPTGPDNGDTERLPEGGNPGLETGRTVAYAREVALPHLPSETETA